MISPQETAIIAAGYEFGMKPGRLRSSDVNPDRLDRKTSWKIQQLVLGRKVTERPSAQTLKLRKDRRSECQKNYHSRILLVNTVFDFMLRDRDEVEFTDELVKLICP
jgi:hypothetical protein